MQQDQLAHIVFLDIETVPLAPNFEYLTEREQYFWSKKSDTLKKDENDTPATLYQRAGIYAEFGKIVCISIGVINNSNPEEPELRIKSFYSDDEAEILTKFAEMLQVLQEKRKSICLCAHNGKEFDFPFIGRRFIINKLPLPKILQVQGFPSWKTPFLDTMELWRFGDYKNFTSLDLLTHILEIPSPKNDIDGSQVYETYYVENDLERIANYCQQDVIAVAQLFLRYQNMPLIDEERIVIADAN